MTCFRVNRANTPNGILLYGIYFVQTLSPLELRSSRFRPSSPRVQSGLSGNNALATWFFHHVYVRPPQKDYSEKGSVHVSVGASELQHTIERNIDMFVSFHSCMTRRSESSSRQRARGPTESRRWQCSGGTHTNNNITFSFSDHQVVYFSSSILVYRPCFTTPMRGALLIK